MANENLTTIATLGAPVFGFSGLLIGYLFKHGNRLEKSLSDKEKMLVEKNSLLTDSLVHNAKLEAEIKRLEALVSSQELTIIGLKRSLKSKEEEKDGDS